jgi:hypothetical protein
MQLFVASHYKKNLQLVASFLAAIATQQRTLRKSDYTSLAKMRGGNGLVQRELYVFSVSKKKGEGFKKTNQRHLNIKTNHKNTKTETTQKQK